MAQDMIYPGEGSMCTLEKGEIHCFGMKCPMDRSTKQKFNKETQTLNDTIDQLDLIDIYRTIHPKTMNFNFF